MAARVRCRAVFLDAGGVIVLPRRELVRAALASVGLAIDPGLVAAGHYRAAAELDRGSGEWASPAYLPALCRALGVPPDRMPDAVAALSELARNGQKRVQISQGAEGA